MLNMDPLIQESSLNYFWVVEQTSMVVASGLTEWDTARTGQIMPKPQIHSERKPLIICLAFATYVEIFANIHSLSTPAMCLPDPSENGGMDGFRAGIGWQHGLRADEKPQGIAANTGRWIRCQHTLVTSGLEM